MYLFCVVDDERESKKLPLEGMPGVAGGGRLGRGKLGAWGEGRGTCGFRRLYVGRGGAFWKRTFYEAYLSSGMYIYNINRLEAAMNQNIQKD